MQDTREGRLLLHAVNTSDTRMEEIFEQLKTVLEEIEAYEIHSLLVMNKINILNGFLLPVLIEMRIMSLF
ncbi:MAG: hypothetical protein ACTS73_01020 [Arsenophonus sp. NEOnobi-MAG3]